MSDNARKHKFKQFESLRSTLRGGTSQWLRRMILGLAEEFLEIDYGNGNKQRVLIGTKIIVGRGPNADVCIVEDALLSRRHFSIHCQGHQAILSDLSSTNGTWLDGCRIDTLVITSPVAIIAGSTRFFVQCPARLEHY